MSRNDVRERARRLWARLRETFDHFLDDHCPQFAAGMSYYALFALFPIALLSVSAFGLFVSDEVARRHVIDFVLDNLPLREGQGRADLERLLQGVTSQAGTFGLIGIAGLIFSASGLMAAIRAALNEAWDVTSSRPFVRGKALDVLAVLGVGALIALSATVTLGQQLVASLSDELESALGAVGSVLATLLLSLGRLAPIAIAFVAFAALYRLVPATDVAWRAVWPAALAAAVGFEMAKIGFGIYLGSFASYGAVYGSLATVVTFLVFVFVVANIFLFGAEFAAQRARAPGGPKAADGSRGV